MGEPEIDQQSELRSYPQINSAIDSINDKIYELRKDVDSMMVLDHLILGYADGKLNEDEVARLKAQFDQASEDKIRKFCSLIKEIESHNSKCLTITAMIEELDEGRWEKSDN